MSKTKFTCKQCNSPIPTKLVKKYNFNICPTCGHLYPKCIEDIKQYFRIIQLSEELEKAGNLITTFTILKTGIASAMIMLWIFMKIPGD